MNKIGSVRMIQLTAYYPGCRAICWSLVSIITLLLSFGSTNKVFALSNASITNKTPLKIGATNSLPPSILVKSPCPSVVYVTQSGAGVQDGSDWSNAFSGTALQTAINTASPCGAAVWVAEGIYLPQGDRNARFSLLSGVKLYGGFAGTEATLSGRQIAAHPTVLSGNINDPDSKTDNTFQILVAQNISEAGLDGVTISGGYNEFGPGAISIESSTLVLENCLIRDNEGYGFSHLNSSSGSVEITSCTFLSGSSGVNVINSGGSMQLNNCLFINNKGANLQLSGGNAKVINCLFTGMDAPGSNGGIGAISGASLTMINSTVSGNNAYANAGLYIGGDANATVTNCIFWDNQGGGIQADGTLNITYSLIQNGYVGDGNISSDPTFVNTANVDFRLKDCSPAINAGSSGSIDAIIDLDGQVRKFGVVDMGAYEYQSAPSSLSLLLSVSPATTICAGTAVTIEASGASDYSWNTGETEASIVVSPTSSTAFSVTGMTGSCSGTATTALQVNPGISLSISASSLSVATGGSATLIASGAETYSWNTGEVGDNIVVSPSLTTVFSVTGTPVEGCPGVASITLVNVCVPELGNVIVSDLLMGNGTYIPDGTVNGAPQWVLQSENFRIAWNNEQWELIYPNGSVTIATNTGGSKTNFPVKGWQGGFFGTPTLTGFSGSLLTPDVTIGSLPSSTICTGNSITLTASGASDYVWSNGQTGATITVNPMNTIAYSVTGSTGLCYNVTSTTITASASPTITVSLLPATTILSGNSATITAGGADSYIWSNGSTENPLILPNIMSTTNLSVTGTTGSCIGITSATIPVICDPGIIADAVSVTQTAVLGSNNCSVQLIGKGYGTGYTVTGPEGYVFSSVFRYVGNYTLTALDVKLPGVYTFMVNYTNECGETSSDSMTYIVTGRACR